MDNINEPSYKESFNGSPVTHGGTYTPNPSQPWLNIIVQGVAFAGAEGRNIKLKLSANAKSNIGGNGYTAFAIVDADASWSERVILSKTARTGGGIADLLTQKGVLVYNFEVEGTYSIDVPSGATHDVAEVMVLRGSNKVWGQYLTSGGHLDGVISSADFEIPHHFPLQPLDENNWYCNASYGISVRATTTNGSADIDLGHTITLTSIEFQDGSTPESLGLRVSFPESGAISPNLPPGDYDGDLNINGNDFLVWQRGFGIPNADRYMGDGNDDGLVDGADLAIWQSAFGQATTSSTGTIPEPPTSALCLCTLAGLTAFKLVTVNRFRHA